MAEHSKIEWCDHTFNPWVGCTKVSPGCDHCYAQRDTPVRVLRSKGQETWGPGASRVRTSHGNWQKPIKWQSKAASFMAEHGRRQRVFCASLADVFDNEAPAEWRAALFALIAGTPDLDWLLLTKRIGNVARMIEAPGMQKCGLPKNVWLGATITSQAEADRDIPKLLDVPACVRFLSMEPLLGPVDLSSIRRPLAGESYAESNVLVHKSTLDRGADRAAIDWVIVGGESGPGARPMHPDWARSLRDQCKAAGVPFLFKQWGEWLPWHQFVEAGIEDPAEQTRFRTMEWRDDRWVDVGFPGWMDTADGHVDDMECVGRVGKKAAGRLLDGVEHNGFPTAQ